MSTSSFGTSSTIPKSVSNMTGEVLSVKAHSVGIVVVLLDLLNNIPDVHSFCVQVNDQEMVPETSLTERFLGLYVGWWVLSDDETPLAVRVDLSNYLLSSFFGRPYTLWREGVKGRGELWSSRSRPFFHSLSY